MKLLPDVLWKLIRAIKPERTAWFELADRANGMLCLPALNETKWRD